MARPFLAAIRRFNGTPIVAGCWCWRPGAAGIVPVAVAARSRRGAPMSDRGQA